MACVKTTEKDIKGHRGKKELKWKEACFQLKWICWLIQKSGNFKENVDFFCLIFSFKIKTRTGVLTKCWLLQTTRNNIIAFTLLLFFPMSPCTCSCFCYLGEGSVHIYHPWEKKIEEYKNSHNWFVAVWGDLLHTRNGRKQILVVWFPPNHKGQEKCKVQLM